MATWIDTAIITAVVLVGIFILYKPLKEPIDLLFNSIKGLLGWGRDKITGVSDYGGEVIRYG